MLELIEDISTEFALTVTQIPKLETGEYFRPIANENVIVLKMFSFTLVIKELWKSFPTLWPKTEPYINFGAELVIAIALVDMIFSASEYPKTCPYF